MISFDTDILVYATAPGGNEKTDRARELLGGRSGQQTAFFCCKALPNSAMSLFAKAGIPVEDVARIVQAWCAVLPIQAGDEGDLYTALDAVRAHRLAFWDAMLWASAQRAGVRHLLTEDFQDGFVLGDLTFVNPFIRDNDRLIEKLLPLS